MSALAEKRLNVDEFLSWADGREGKWEAARRRTGVDVARTGSPYRDENRRHVYASHGHRPRGRSVPRLRGGDHGAYSENRAFVPDALVVWPAPPPDDVEISIRSSSSKFFRHPAPATITGSN